MRMTKSLEGKHIIFYYLVLLVILLLRKDMEEPDLIYRISYLAAFFLPIMTRYRQYFLPLSICFMTIGTYGYAYSYFPYMMVNYAVIALITAFLSNKLFYAKFSPFWIGTLLYIGLIDVVDNGTLADLFYSLLTVSIGFILTNNSDSKKNRRIILISFTVISFSLSLQYLLNYDLFLQSYNAGDGIERAGWTDPNYLSCIIGMGVLSAVILLSGGDDIRLLLKIYCVSVIIVSIISQVLLASRGGLLCTSISLMIIILFSKAKNYIKAFAFIFAVAFIIWLYNNNYFDLLLYRMEEDTMGSGRLEIWSSKLTAFVNEYTPISWIFGIGQKSAYNLASSSSGVGFHNDFIAVLCSYGLVGFSLFIYIMFVYPFKISGQSYRVQVLSIVIYLAVACLTLEPFTAGRITYLCFYILVLFCFKNKNEKDISCNTIF